MTDEERNAIVKYRIEKSHTTFKEAIDVLSMNHICLCANRLYYSIFHIASALLISDGHIAQTHAGVQRLINQFYVKAEILSREDSKLINKLFSMRQQGDYGDIFDYDKEEIESTLADTEFLLKKIENLICLK